MMEQQDLFETATARSLLDQLFADSHLYRTSGDYKALLDFVVRLRGFAPFNAMLLQLQKPGLSYAASASDWRDRFGREVREAARPLLILWPFGPVSLVYDVMDTDGKSLPQDVQSFFACGPVNEELIARICARLMKAGIECHRIDAGDRNAGSIRRIDLPSKPGEAGQYRILFNQNHPAPTQFATIAHELGHMFLGHLGKDAKRQVRDRARLDLTQRELEAESVSFMVCSRSNVQSRSQKYLANYVSRHTTVDSMDLYTVMRAAGQVEAMMGVGAQTRLDQLGKVSAPAQTNKA
jgi:hypothetical protein